MKRGLLETILDLIFAALFGAVFGIVLGLYFSLKCLVTLSILSCKEVHVLSVCAFPSSQLCMQS